MISTILAVDADRAVLRRVERVLRGAGYQILTATDAAQARRRARERRVDVALVSRDVDGGDGLALLGRIRSEQPACLRVVLAPTTRDAAIREALSRGDALRALPTPFDDAALLGVLDEVFATSRRMALFAASQLRSVSRLEAAMLEDCFRDDLLHLALQPIVDLGSDGAVAGYEVLLRSSHAVLSSPLAVLKVAEQHGRLSDVGAFVFGRALEALEGIEPDAALFLNVHPDQMEEPERLAEGLQPLRPFAGRIVIEVDPPRSAVAGPEWQRSLELLREGDFPRSLDDVGGGESTLAALAAIEPAWLKLDMEIVRGVDTDRRKQRVLRVIAGVAEAAGVETASEADTLRHFGVRWMQGFHFGRPLSVSVPELAPA